MQILFELFANFIFISYFCGGKEKRKDETTYIHPGNLVDNEIDLMLLFSMLYNQVYYTSEHGFYKKMMPLYDHLMLHMDMMEMLGKGKHPLYDYVKQGVDHAKEVLGE